MQSGMIRNRSLEPQPKLGGLATASMRRQEVTCGQQKFHMAGERSQPLLGKVAEIREHQVVARRQDQLVTMDVIKDADLFHLARKRQEKRFNSLFKRVQTVVVARHDGRSGFPTAKAEDVLEAFGMGMADIKHGGRSRF